MDAKQHDHLLDGLFSSLSQDLNASSEPGRDCPILDPAFDRLYKRCQKRASYSRPHLSREAEDRFVALNARVGSTVVCLDADLVSNAAYFIRVTLERYTSYMGSPFIQETLDFGHLFSLWYFGPGTSVGVKGTHTAEKIGQAMTCTKGAFASVKKLRSNNAYFRVFDLLCNGIIEVPGSRLSTVPKNADTMRTIAIEPSGNMCLQLAAGKYLEGALRLAGLDIRKQETLNKSLACRGSIDGSLATIDLSSASDMFKPELIKALMPREWYEYLVAIRSPEILVRGEPVTLNMMSTMGNGFTFPLMTLCLVSLIYALRCRVPTSPNLRVDWRHTGVYGDDIIVPAHEYDDLCAVLASAGLVVNHDKSFNSGPFRESCGGDFHLGRDITPFYVEDLRTDQRVYVAINKIILWSRRENFYPVKTLRFLLSLLKREPLLVPEWESPDSGILTHGCSQTYRYLKRVPRVRKYPGTPLAQHFAVMLCAGGYLESGTGDASFFTPRPRLSDKKAIVVARKGRLPSGYLSGWDPLRGPESESKSASLMINLLIG